MAELAGLALACFLAATLVPLPSEAALFAFQALGLNDAGAPAQQIGQMKYEDVFAAVQKGGDVAQGKDIYLRSGCIACHRAPNVPSPGSSGGVCP